MTDAAHDVAGPTTDPSGPVADDSGPVADELAQVEDEQWHRLSPRMLAIHPITELGRALPALVGIFLAGSGSNAGHYWGLGAAGLVALYSLTRWFTTRLRITPQYVQLRHGLLRRRTVSTSRDRIRTVDVTSHVLHRLLGLARVVVGTGLNDRKGAGRLVLDGLTLDVAVTLRDDLLHRAPSADAGTADPSPLEAAGAEELARLNPRWIRYAPFTLSGVVTGLIIWGFFWRVQSESRVDLLRHGPLRRATDWYTALSTGTAVVLTVVGLLVFVAVTSTAGYLLAFWNFRLVRHDGGTVQVTRGLLTTRATSVERRRLVGVHLTEPLPLRWVGAARTTVVATGLRTGRGSERGGEVLLPPAPRQVALAVATEVLDRSPVLTAELVAHPAAARRRRLVRSVLGGLTLLALGVLGWVSGGSVWPVAIGALALLGSVPLGLDRYSNLGHAHVDGRLVIGSGSLVRRRTVLSDTAVIGWNLRTSPFQRRQGVLTLEATTAAGRQGYPLTDLDAAGAIGLARSVTPGLLEQFLDRPAAAGTPTAHPATSR